MRTDVGVSFRFFAWLMSMLVILGMASRANETIYQYSRDFIGYYQKQEFTYLERLEQIYDKRNNFLIYPASTPRGRYSSGSDVYTFSRVVKMPENPERNLA